MVIVLNSKKHKINVKKLFRQLSRSPLYVCGSVYSLAHLEFVSLYTATHVSIMHVLVTSKEKKTL